MPMMQIIQRAVLPIIPNNNSIIMVIMYLWHWIIIITIVSGHVVVDLCATTSGAIYVDTSLDHFGKTEVNSKARRYVLPLNSSGDEV